MNNALIKLSSIIYRLHNRIANVFRRNYVVNRVSGGGIFLIYLEKCMCRQIILK